MWSNREELGAALRDAGLGDWAPRLAELAAHSVIFVSGPVEEGSAAPIGTCRLGGEPDMPPDVAWPVRPPFKSVDPPFALSATEVLGRWHWLHRLFRTQRWRRESWMYKIDPRPEREIRSRTWPLSFIAQIDFAEVHAVRALPGFPSSGRLWLFCDPHVVPWGTAEDQERVCAIFSEAPVERLERRPSPQEFAEPVAQQWRPNSYGFKPRALRPTAWLLPPTLGSAGQPCTWPPSEWPLAEVYQKFWDDLYARYPDAFGSSGWSQIHQMGGTAFCIQNPVEAECVKYNEQPNPGEHECTAQHLAGAADWQLVLQIDSDFEVGMQWGDAGRLYLCARKQDLAARRFDRCWIVTQCY